MRLFRRAVILSHRYLGIVLSLLVIMWFATGITMIYWGGMPRVTPELRLERMQAVDFSRVRLTPAEAAARGDLDPIGRATLATLLDRPVYRFGSRNPTMVFADTGELFAEEREEVKSDQNHQGEKNAKAAAAAVEPKYDDRAEHRKDQRCDRQQYSPVPDDLRLRSHLTVSCVGVV